MAKEKTFYYYFKENMNELGLPAPESLFSTAMAAGGTIGTITSALDKFGPNATLRTVATAGVGAAAGPAIAAISRLAVAFGAIGASYYAGAAAGSLVVASNKRLDMKLATIDILFAISTKGFAPPKWIHHALHAHPEILDPSKRKPVSKSLVDWVI